MTLKLKEIRTIKGYSQQEVADYLGCTAVSYSRYESGNRSPSLEMLIKLADYFDVTIDYLLGRNTGAPQTLSNDPICIESTGQGFRGLSLAACHACTLLPETSCESANCLLDRAAVVGLPDDNGVGYFSDLLYSE